MSPLLPEILALHGKWASEREAVICGEQRLCWGEFVDGYHQLSHGLIALGVRPGNRVGIVMSNGIPMLQAIMAIMAAGAVSVPINLSVADEAIVAMMQNAEVVAMIVTDDQAERVAGLQSAMPASLRHFVAESPSVLFTSILNLSAGQSTEQPELTITGSDELNIIYSSGTTGMPKGIVHTHAGRRDWAYDLCIALRYHSCAKTLISIGLYSNISWVAMLCTLLAGGTVVIQQRFDVLDFLNTVNHERITHTAMVPIQFQRITDVMEKGEFDVSSMQAMMSCGSPLYVDLKQNIFKHFNCGIVELYGLTEGIITTMDPEYADGRWASVGKPLLGTDIAIIDDSDKPLPRGEVGEIVSRARFTMPGYLNRDDASEEASYTDDKGNIWLRSGDLGYVDEEGYVYIVDRKKDMVLSGGQNIYPQDIEAVVVQHHGVSEVAVIGAASKRWGETPIALVVASGAIKAKELLVWANQRLGKQQRLADVILIDELPRNPNGKILKRTLRDMFKDKAYE